MNGRCRWGNHGRDGTGKREGTTKETKKHETHVGGEDVGGNHGKHGGTRNMRVTQTPLAASGSPAYLPQTISSGLGDHDDRNRHASVNRVIKDKNQLGFNDLGLSG